MPRTKAIEEMNGLRSARQQSPFFTMVIRDEWLVSFDYAIVIHSIQSMLKNSIHSIQKLMNGPTVRCVFDGCRLNTRETEKIYDSEVYDLPVVHIIFHVS